jgi:hypothetical protein
MARALMLAVAALAVGCGATDALRGVLDAHMTTEEALALAGGVGAPYTHVRFGLAPRYTGESASGRMRSHGGSDALPSQRRHPTRCRLGGGLWRVVWRVAFRVDVCRTPTVTRVVTVAWPLCHSTVATAPSSLCLR